MATDREIIEAREFFNDLGDGRPEKALGLWLLDQLEAAERDRERLRELRRMISHHLYTPQDIDRIRDAAKEKA